MENITKEQLGTLIKLQEVEIEYRHVQSVLNQAPERLDELNTRLDELEQTAKEREESVAGLNKAYRDGEVDIQENDSKIVKCNEKLALVKDNKGYQAILKEIDGIKKQNSKLEDDLLNYLDQIDEESQEVEKEKSEYSQGKLQIDGEKKLIEQEMNAEKEKLVQFDSERMDLLTKIDKELINLFNVMLVKGMGVALSSVKDSICQGCFMNIPPQMYNELQKFGTLKNCPHCHRIIYYSVEEC
ncbi:MAG: hypothetical protein HN737_10290 [Desulfobacterales bacterium]|jgi:uncharacterized protein|nr:hypothetical protein [Desulfobacteraceae bacterium]MBT7085284.1 hypothetical protein [Desulfobacterales bacterium]MBT7697783.1 hypothetical protein [Desulfobacterales bacterium]